MNRRPLHGEAGGTGNFDVHLDDRDVIEIEVVAPAGVCLIETGELPVRNAENGLDGGTYVNLDLRQLEDLLQSLTQARDFMREQSA